MRRAKHLAFVAVPYLCIGVALTILVGLLGTIALRGVSALRLDFLLEPMREGGASGGIRDQIVGTAILVATAAFVATPLAVGTALTHSFYARRERTRRRIALALHVLNGTPTILLGIAGLLLFVLLFDGGKSWLWGGILLGIVILPTVAIATLERMEAIPRSYVEHAFALGLTESQVVRTGVVPQSAGAIATGVLLGLARAAGETAPILFCAVVFSGAGLPDGVVHSPVVALPYHVFVLAQDSFDPAVAGRVWGTATVLLLGVVGLSALALPFRLRLHEEARHD